MVEEVPSRDMISLGERDEGWDSPFISLRRNGAAGRLIATRSFAATSPLFAAAPMCRPNNRRR
nr:unnamed protein product [Digitaria exilis]